VVKKNLAEFSMYLTNDEFWDVEELCFGYRYRGYY
jgi:hypothetical protein